MKKKQTIVTAFGRALARFGFSINQVVRLTGIPYSTVWCHYVGTRKPKAEYAIKYEEKLGIPRSEIRPDLWPKGE